jgi:hypothetical protein
LTDTTGGIVLEIVIGHETGTVDHNGRHTKRIVIKATAIHFQRSTGFNEKTFLSELPVKEFHKIETRPKKQASSMVSFFQAHIATKR